MLRTYTLSDPENYTSFINNNDVIHGIAKRPSIWKITSDDELPFLVTPATIERIRSNKAFGENTWNVHVILAKNIPSFDHITKDGSTFEWKPNDRFIVLIACQEEMLNKSRLDDILKTLWSKRKVHSVLVAEAIAVVNDTRIDQAVRTYNPFAKVNDSGS
ncbi:glutamate receptor delta-2 subunit [Lasius niger]|uniref:Glutamate receptor delta-2 subunit n=1 Tax=Lasius niger TaxID=67767 RepID=A0A0J7KTS1_LASNI|nr:glutamate receptor delta-2 subunit [Lasius niger]